MRRLLLVTHRSIEQEGGPAARWRAFARYLSEHGWELDVLSAAERPGASEFDAGSRAVSARAVVMSRAARLGAPDVHACRRATRRAAAVDAVDPRGARALRRRIEHARPSGARERAAARGAARSASRRPGARAADRRAARSVGRQPRVRRRRARALEASRTGCCGDARRVIACTPEAVADLRRRHPLLAERVVEMSNGFDPEVRAIAARALRRSEPAPQRAPRVLTLLHSAR